ncbi:hypothetical protein L218DRAFT_1000365 [Marasmius fiardii PR-910]|nr:hypothetical protein L218DRAFT_1000365 [Marasmius fiardii PR-910]
MALIGTSGVSVTGDIANIVHGNQIINYNTHIAQQKEKEKEPTLYNQFRKIRLGDIRIIQDICQNVNEWCWSAERGWHRTLKFKETISIAKVFCKAAKDSEFTVVSYDGPGAAQKWEDDFRCVARVRGADTMQLFGFNHLSVSHLLIFHGELLPLNHWYVNHKYMRCFICGLARQWGCHVEEIWLDLQTGVLCSGMLYGSGFSLTILFIPVGQREARLFDSMPLPSSAELLKKDVYVDYLSSLPLDNRVEIQLLEILNDEVQDSTRVSPGLYTIMVRCFAWKSYLRFRSDAYHWEQGDLMPNGTTR